VSVIDAKEHMMIEVVSYPADLTQWDPTKTPFYLELFGDTSPVLERLILGVAEAVQALPHQPVRA